ncbi:MAG: hypothetical protein KGI58_04015, partial [Patescibacteria group bacterium]|nr:hypothetical protein [Patescibacteria group bacterium]
GATHSICYDEEIQEHGYYPDFDKKMRHNSFFDNVNISHDELSGNDVGTKKLVEFVDENEDFYKKVVDEIVWMVDKECGDYFSYNAGKERVEYVKKDILEYIQFCVEDGIFQYLKKV